MKLFSWSSGVLTFLALSFLSCAPQASAQETKPSPSSTPSSTPGQLVAPVQENPLAEVMDAMGLQRVQGNPSLLDFTATTLEGKTVKLSDYKGKVVFLNFWATWCPPCRAEMPTIEKLWKKLSSNKDFVWLAVDAQEKPDVVKAFIQKTGYTFPILLDTTGQGDAEYGVQAIPTTYVIDKTGHVLGGRAGGKEWDTPEVLQGIEKLLAQNP